MPHLKSFELDARRNVDYHKPGQVAVVSDKDLSEKEKLTQRYKHSGKTVRFDSDGAASDKLLQQNREKPGVSALVDQMGQSIRGQN